MRLIFWIIILVVVGGLAWIRLAPSDPATWNVDPQVAADQDLASGVRRSTSGNDALYAALHRIILETPRTEVLAGSPGEGRVTYITRSQWMGFPDYTTTQLEDGRIEIYGRQRFGQSDMGTNRTRVDAWLSQLTAERGDD